VFDTMANGIRALGKQLLVYQDRYGLSTIRQCIQRWAPQSENDTDGYVAFVAHVCELQPDDNLNLHDFNTLYWMTVAIGEQENGHDAFTKGVTDADLDAGIHAALA